MTSSTIEAAFLKEVTRRRTGGEGNAEADKEANVAGEERNDANEEEIAAWEIRSSSLVKEDDLGRNVGVIGRPGRLPDTQIIFIINWVFYSLCF
ncbi:hypothetical protein ZOSMA_14G00750 [Zostera marina]|uniref:Uncharacterized protein n=1 Tax=Zostera marina TaxID=29655 RepID=A0A0K9PWA2_ZOSMR|nr:hypothetical protein ZOSMA_14G00750 [Zostera marina]